MIDKIKKSTINDLIKVDFTDKCIGFGSKEELHKIPTLHRAFSVFIYHNDKMLIQKRNINKYHSGGLWTNACCSHFIDGMKEIDCISARLKQELGISATPNYLAKFVYYHKFSDHLFEYEYDHIYVLDYNGNFLINKDEIEEIKWVDFSELSIDIVNYPSKYTVWFVTALPMVLQSFE